MPMIGVIDPTHKERASTKAGRYPKWLTLEELINESQTDNLKWAPWPYELVQSVLGEFQERGDRISTTTLTSPCPRGEVLQRKVDYIGDLDQLYVPLRGTMVHAVLEKHARLGSIAEVRFATTIDGIEITCSPDLLTTETLIDYKVPVEQASIPPFGYPYRHQTEQLMLNAFICRHAEWWSQWDDVTNEHHEVNLPFDPREHPVSAVAVIYLGPRYPKVIQYERKTLITTPTGERREIKQPYVWSDDEVLEEMRPRLHVMQAALRDFPLFPPGAEEVWGGKPGWECPGPPLCKLPNCLARRYPDNLVWEKP